MMSSSPSSECSPSSSPLAANAPKFGTPVPNRIFVGGIAPNTTEAELHALFSSFGNVKATKIISDRAGVSKGYGFVTFETEEEARRIQKEADNITLKDRKLNIAPAIKKQPFARVYGDLTGLTEAGVGAGTGTILYHNGVPYTYHNGMAFFTNSSEGVYQYAQPQAASYPVVYPQTVYLPHQPFSYQANTSPAVPSHHYLYAASPIGGSVSSPSSSVPSSPSPSPSHSSSGKTNAAARNSSRCSSESICSTAPSHPGEFYTLYNGAPLATAPGGLTAISMVPANCFSFALAPAPPLADHRNNSGPLTPTSPDYHLLDAELTRNEVMSNNGRSVFSSPCGYNNLYTHSPCHSPVMYGHHTNPFSSNTSANNGYNSPNYHHHGNSYPNETNENKFFNPMNQNQPQNHSNNGNNHTTNGNNQNNSYKLSSSTGNGYGSGSNKTSGGNNGGNNQTGNSSNSNNNSGRKNSAISCSLGSPVRNFNGNYRHPSTPKSTSGYTGRPRDRSTSSTTNTGYDVVSSRTFRHLHGQQPHLVAKSVNGVTVMALPPPLMVTSGTNGPTTMLNVSAKDHQLVQGDFSNHLPPMTPPRTPATPPRRDNGNKVTDPIMAIKKLAL